MKTIIRPILAAWICFQFVCCNTTETTTTVTAPDGTITTTVVKEKKADPNGMALAATGLGVLGGLADTNRGK